METTSPSPTYHGGETVAVSRLDRHLERKAWVASFERPKMTTQSLFANQYCVSPYLRFGCLSPRLFYWKLTELYKKVIVIRSLQMWRVAPFIVRSFVYPDPLIAPSFRAAGIASQNLPTRLPVYLLVCCSICGSAYLSVSLLICEC